VWSSGCVLIAFYLDGYAIGRGTPYQILVAEFHMESRESSQVRSNVACLLTASHAIGCGLIVRYDEFARRSRSTLEENAPAANRSHQDLRFIQSFLMHLSGFAVDSRYNCLSSVTNEYSSFLL
jgi:hypothetical protein